MKRKLIALAMSTAMLAMLVAPTAFADEEVTVDVSITAGTYSLTAQAGGQWADGMTLVNVETGVTPTISEWANGVTLRADLSGASDYLNVVDETATDGFYIEISTTDLSNDADDDDIPADTNIALYAQHPTPSGTTAAEIGSSPVTTPADMTGDTVNYSATSSTSCSAAEDGTGISFHSDFSAGDYAYALGNSATEIVTSTIECPVNGIVRFDRLEWAVGSGYALGDWSSTLSINIFDGASL